MRQKNRQVTFVENVNKTEDKLEQMPTTIQGLLAKFYVNNGLHDFI